MHWGVRTVNGQDVYYKESILSGCEWGGNYLTSDGLKHFSAEGGLGQHNRVEPNGSVQDSLRS